MKKYYGIEKDGQLGITVDNKVVEAKGKFRTERLMLRMMS